MNYPKFKNKHLDHALITAKGYVTWKNSLKNRHTIYPQKYILIYYPQILKHFKKIYEPEKIKFSRLITIYRYKNLGVVPIMGVGSPNATMIMEELIAIGGKEFLNIGFAGGLGSSGVFLCKKAIIDEGTSYHYDSPKEFSYPDIELTSRFEKRLKRYNLDFQKATTWTIDAPYRETKSEVQYYEKHGVRTVEMEASALFTLAKIRKVKIAAGFVVSDILREDMWHPQFDVKTVNNKLLQLFDVAVKCLL